MIAANSLVSSYFLALTFMLVAANLNSVAQALPTVNVELYPNSDKFGSGIGVASDKLTGNDESAKQSFHELIHLKSPNSTVIGEIKPNATTLEMVLLRKKIAETILGMQEMEKQSQANNQQHQSSPSSSDLINGPGPSGSGGVEKRSDCFIEVTRIDRIPGKCHRVVGGLPVCQSTDYMAVSSDCN